MRENVPPRPTVREIQRRSRGGGRGNLQLNSTEERGVVAPASPEKREGE